MKICSVIERSEHKKWTAKRGGRVTAITLSTVTGIGNFGVDSPFMQPQRRLWGTSLMFCSHTECRNSTSEMENRLDAFEQRRTKISVLQSSTPYGLHLTIIWVNVGECRPSTRRVARKKFSVLRWKATDQEKKWSRETSNVDEYEPNYRYCN